MTVKVAVDATAKSYWTDYFAEYGEQWVKPVPRRIVARLVAAKVIDARHAELGSKTGAVAVLPTALARRADGGATFEGYLRIVDAPTKNAETGTTSPSTPNYFVCRAELDSAGLVTSAKLFTSAGKIIEA